MFSAPLQFVLSGVHFYSGTSVSNRGSNGAYWSISRYLTTYAYELYFSSYNVYPQYSFEKRFGNVVRCLAL